MKQIRINALIVLGVILIITGVAFNFIPMATYYFGEYSRATYHSGLVTNSELDYYGFYGIFITNDSSTMAYGIIFNITITGSNQYDLHTTVYALYGYGSPLGLDVKKLPNDPFTYSSKQLIYQNETTDSPLLSFIIPQSDDVQLPQLNINYMIDTNSSRNSPTNFVGNPYYYSTSLTLLSESQSKYVTFGNQKVLYGYFTLADPTSLANQSCPLFANLNGTNTQFGLALGGGNTVPNQDWAGWLRYGLGVSFPANFILMIAGVVVLIIKVRRA